MNPVASQIEKRLTHFPDEYRALKEHALKYLLPDDDLLRIINADSSEYQLEAIVYAKSELRGRGVVPDAAGLEQAFTVKSTPSSAPEFLAVLTGRVATFTIGLICLEMLWLD